MTVEITEVRNVVTVSPVTQAVTVTETVNTVEIASAGSHAATPSHHPRDYAVVVGPSASEADYTTIQAAHDAGAPIIFVRDGSYAGFTWSDLAVKRIIGASPDGVKITGDCTFTTDGVTMASVWFYPAAADQKLKIDAPVYFGTPVKFENCSFGGEAASPGALPIFLTKIVPGANAGKPEFANCRFRGNPPCLWAKAWTFQASGSVWTDVTDGVDAGQNGVLPDTAIFANAAAGDILYLGVASKLRLPFGFIAAPQGPTFASVGLTPTYEYWNGTAWVALTTVGLHADAKSFRARGYVTFTPPSNWSNTGSGATQNGFNAYWMRLRATAGGVSPVVRHLRPMGNQAFSDFDPDAMVRRLWTSPTFDNCSLEGYGLSHLVIDCTGALTNPNYPGVFRLRTIGSRGTYLIAPAGSDVEIVTDRTGNYVRGALLGQGSKAKLFMYGGTNMDAGWDGEGQRVASATANTLTFLSNADGMGTVQMGATYEGCEVLILHGTGQGQRRVVIDGDDNQTITVRDNWTVTPDTTSIAIMYDPVQYAVGIEASCDVEAVLSRFSIGVRAVGTAGNLFAVKGVFSGVGICVQPVADASILKRPYTVAAPVYTVGSDIHGGRGVIVDMAGQGTYTATPEANAAEGNIVAPSTASKGAVIVTGRTAATKITAPSVPSDSLTGAGTSGSVFIPVADNEQSMGSATLALKEMWAYIQGVRNCVEFDEAAQAAAPGANKGRLQVIDNGAGKSQLVIRFPTGAVQIVATEP